LDLENRNYDFYGVGKINAGLISGEERDLMQAYCDGINDYAKNTRMLPFEFYLTFTKW
jgi:protein-S-isoprenylcysteine O-methyltransferase Ste14